ncbi:MAG: vWA domain-containing protein [Pseudomonadota bacterium]
MPLPADRSLPALAAALRRAGVKVGTDALLVAAEALVAVGPERRADVRDALRATLVRSPADFDLFDRLFGAFFPEGLPLPEGSRLDLPPERAQRAPGSRRLAEALPPSRAVARPPRRGREAPPDASGTASDREVLHAKDFEQMSAAELAEARALIAAQVPRVWLRRTRRHAPDPAGRDLDLARMLRGARGRFDALGRARRARRLQPRDWVVLVDVSGSMAVYARTFLYFAHALARRSPRVEVFAFATRLTRLTRAMALPDPDAAVAAACTQVLDWDGGTRIGECLGEYNRRWAKRAASRGAAVLLLTDGLETGDPLRLEAEARRLARTARPLLWVNPLLRSAAWQPLAAGAAALARQARQPVSAHDLDSLAALGRLLAG